MMKRVSEAEEAGLNISWSEIPKTHFCMAWLKCILAIPYEMSILSSCVEYPLARWDILINGATGCTL